MNDIYGNNNCIFKEKVFLSSVFNGQDRTGSSFLSFSTKKGPVKATTVNSEVFIIKAVMVKFSS